MVTPSHRLVYGYAEVLKSISAFERRVINNSIDVITGAKLLGTTNENEFRFRNIQGQTIFTKPRRKLR